MTTTKEQQKKTAEPGAHSWVCVEGAALCLRCGVYTLGKPRRNGRAPSVLEKNECGASKSVKQQAMEAAWGVVGLGRNAYAKLLRGQKA